MTLELVGVLNAVSSEIKDLCCWTLINSVICTCNMEDTVFKNLVSSKGAVVVGACTGEAEEGDTVDFFLALPLPLPLPFCGGLSAVVSVAVVALGCTTSSSSSVAPPLVWLDSASFMCNGKRGFRKDPEHENPSKNTVGPFRTCYYMFQLCVVLH